MVRSGVDTTETGLSKAYLNTTTQQNDILSSSTDRTAGFLRWNRRTNCIARPCRSSSVPDSFMKFGSISVFTASSAEGLVTAESAPWESASWELPLLESALCFLIMKWSRDEVASATSSVCTWTVGTSEPAVNPALCSLLYSQLCAEVLGVMPPSFQNLLNQFFYLRILKPPYH